MSLHPAGIMQSGTGRLVHVSAEWADGVVGASLKRATKRARQMR